MLADYLTDEAYRELQIALLENPELGDVIPGTGGFRKVCWPPGGKADEQETQVV